MRAMDDLEVAIAAARAGGAIVAAGFGRHTSTDFKRRNDPVTEVDRASEQAITELLTAHRPDDAILAEEGTERAGDSRRWLIDPLDGTVNFVHGLAPVSVSIALYDDEAPVVAAVYDPIHAELYAADRNGATLNAEPIRVSDTSELSEALVVTGFPYDHHLHADAYVATLSEMLRHVNGVRRIGSAALDLCYVAAGRIDASWEYDLRPWDLAAGIFIVEAAGGRVTDPHGGPMTPYSRHVVSSNRLLHERVREIVASTFPGHLR